MDETHEWLQLIRFGKKKYLFSQIFYGTEKHSNEGKFLNVTRRKFSSSLVQLIGVQLVKLSCSTIETHQTFHSLCGNKTKNHSNVRLILLSWSHLWCGGIECRSNSAIFTWMIQFCTRRALLFQHLRFCVCAPHLRLCVCVCDAEFRFSHTNSREIFVDYYTPIAFKLRIWIRIKELHGIRWLFFFFR